MSALSLPNCLFAKMQLYNQIKKVKNNSSKRVCVEDFLNIIFLIYILQLFTFSSDKAANWTKDRAEAITFFCITKLSIQIKFSPTLILIFLVKIAAYIMFVKLRESLANYSFDLFLFHKFNRAPPSSSISRPLNRYQVVV